MDTVTKMPRGQTWSKVWRYSYPHAELLIYEVGMACRDEDGWPEPDVTQYERWDLLVLESHIVQMLAKRKKLVDEAMSWDTFALREAETLIRGVMSWAGERGWDPTLEVLGFEELETSMAQLEAAQADYSRRLDRLHGR